MFPPPVKIDVSKLVRDEYYWADNMPVQYNGYDGFHRQHTFNICGNEQQMMDYEIDNIIYTPLKDIVKRM